MRGQDDDLVALLQGAADDLLKNGFYPSFVRKIIVYEVKERLWHQE